jgi:hypothetical protein
MNMTRMLLLLLLLVPGQSTQPSPAPTFTFKSVRITGAELPEWVVWEQTFQRLAHAKGKNTPATYAIERGFTEPELKVLMTEVARHMKEFGAQNVELQQTLEPMIAAGASAEAYAATERRIKLAYRTQVIEARDRVLAALSPEATLVMLQQVARVRDTTTWLAHEPDYKSGFFRLPQ